MKKASAVLEFHILFFLFVLRRFRLQLFFLLLQILHLFRDGVLRLRLLFNLALFRLDDLFSTQEQRDEEKLSKIRDIPLTEIDDFPDHPFKVPPGSTGRWASILTAPGTFGRTSPSPVSLIFPLVWYKKS